MACEGIAVVVAVDVVVRIGHGIVAGARYQPLQGAAGREVRRADLHDVVAGEQIPESVDSTGIGGVGSQGHIDPRGELAIPVGVFVQREHHTGDARFAGIQLPVVVGVEPDRIAQTQGLQVGEVPGQHRRPDHPQFVDLRVHRRNSLNLQFDRADVREVGAAASGDRKIRKQKDGFDLGRA